ncbi:MAG: hypothetical protein L6Q92_12400 [Phycisphaerae bacterium]|nr:hypothetical protein [Phycisphaerae bacterium]
MSCPAVNYHRLVRAAGIATSRPRPTWTIATIALIVVAGAWNGASAQLCVPTPDFRDCPDVICPNPNDQCVKRCVLHFPDSGDTIVTECECRFPESCQAQIVGGAANRCLVPDDGSGTVQLPPAGCHYRNPYGDTMDIIDGLPPNSTIASEFDLSSFVCTPMINVCSFPTFVGDCTDPGGSLGGEKSCTNASLMLNMNGTGALAGYMRVINLPVGIEIHTAPRMPGDPVQSFDTDMFRMFGQITLDPDFDLLRVVGGTDFGLPSPGHTTLALLPGGNWAVDSFFDITYRIDFIGAPGGPLAGLSGSTTGAVRYHTGQSATCVGPCPPGMRCRTIRNVNPDGSIEICCECEPIPCEPLPDFSSCDNQVICPNDGERCIARCMRHFPSTGQVLVTDCDCRSPLACHVEAAPGLKSPCTEPDDGTGTVHLPPENCNYNSPTGDTMDIIDGLPAGTTIECDPTHTNFACNPTSFACSFAQPPTCYQPGGSLGGEQSCSDSQLILNMNGTGTLFGYNRFIALPMAIEVHTAPRIPGNSIQSFDTDMFRMQGQIIGDPDFDLLRITGGTNFGMPSPGHTTLTQLPTGDWAVDSFFDITYRIDFVGAPGGPLAGRSGSTTGTIRLATGTGPVCVGDCPPGMICRQRRTVNPDGSIEICCDCVQPCACLGDMNSDGKVNGLDIECFVGCYTSGTPGLGCAVSPDICYCADMNGDSAFSAVDITLFVTKLLTDPDTLCP